MQRMTREAIQIVYREGEGAVVSLVEGLYSRIDTLEQQLAGNSHNSSKPPSSDGIKKKNTKSLRDPSDRKSGGQPGHPGKTLSLMENPDQVITHCASFCSCGRDLSDIPVKDYERRQIFDLPEPKLDVTEHRAEIKECPCGKKVTAPFPEGVEAPVQYGVRFQSLLVYLKDGQFLPLNRISELCCDLYGYKVSEATIEQARGKCYDVLSVFEEALKSVLIVSNVLHADESGLRVKEKLFWLHLYSTALFTFYGVHQKRGQEAMIFFGNLPRFMGILVHDFWKPYFVYLCFHALCNAHHLRELKFVSEDMGQPWAEKMSNLLIEMLRLVKEHSLKMKALSESEIASLLERYQQILDEGNKANPEHPVKSGKRGRQKKTKAQNLLKRLDDYRKNALAFLFDFRIPFTNNQGEQDIRMLKVQQKISGCFRTQKGAEIFARVRSYISTVRKQGLNVFETVTKALSGNPFVPNLPTG